jgi:hexosaminidase
MENQYGGGNRHKVEVTLTNHSKYTLKNDNWTMYFNWFRSVVDEQESDIIRGETPNGDLSMITPTEKFEDLAPGQSITFPLIGTHYALNKTDAITGCFFVIDKGLGKEVIVESGKTKVLPFPDNSKIIRSASDHLPVQTAEIRYYENQGIQLISKSNLNPILPTPDVQEFKNESLSINKDISIYYHTSLSDEARYLQDKLREIFGVNVNRVKYRSDTFTGFASDKFVLAKGEGLPESYTLDISAKNGILVQGADPAGVFYGIQSFLALIPPDVNNTYESEVTVPVGFVADTPRFPYRGMHIDVSRSFHSKEHIMKFMDMIASFKLNKLHFHITDDEGWRVEIRELPELTEIGAFRGYTKDEKDHLQPTLGSGPYADPNVGNGSGFYSREDFIELLKFAKSRHIEVIPEIDMPGHMRSAVKAMEVRYDRYMKEDKPDSALMYLLTDFEDDTYYTSAQRYHDNTANPCMPSTFRFVKVVIDELVSMYREADAPLSTLHIGGDEVPRGAFANSPVCQAFLESQDTYNDPSELHKYFTTRVKAMLDEYGIKTAGWEEVACKHEGRRRVPDPSLVGQNIVAYVWNNVWSWGAEDLGYQLANAGFPVVLLGANNFYFDFAYNKDPQEPGLYWGGYTDTRSAWEFTPFDITKCAETTLYGDPITEDMFVGKDTLTEEGKKNILGMSGTLWSETMRTWDRMEYMAFPKIIGLAERTWAKAPYWSMIENKDMRQLMRSMDWNQFVNVVGQFALPKLDQYKVNYRIPLPGAIIQKNKLMANIRYPGLVLRYTLDGSEPDATSAVYSSPVSVHSGQVVKIAAFNSIGRKSRTVTLPE